MSPEAEHELTNTTKQMSLEAEHELTNKHYKTDESSGRA